MIDIARMMEDPRRRNLAILAGIALVTVILAAISLAHEARLLAPAEGGSPFFPQLATDWHRIAQIKIESKKSEVDVAFKPERGWVVTSHDNYPAAFDQVRETIAGMAELTVIEPKTARRDWLSYVGLVSPRQGGNGTAITLLDDKGTVLASLIAGKTSDIGDPTGAVGLFARRSGDPQSWLLRSVFVPKSDPSDWLDKRLVSVDRARISEADVDPANGPSYTVRRDSPLDQDFVLVGIPKNREVSYSGAPDGVGAALVDFSFDDVKPARDFDFSDQAHAARVVTKTFDGLAVTVNVIRQGQDYWATVSAEGANPDSRKEARDIDAHANGWAYKLPAYKGAQFTTPLESLLKPLVGKAGAH